MSRSQPRITGILSQEVLNEEVLLSLRERGFKHILYHGTVVRSNDLHDLDLISMNILSDVKHKQNELQKQVSSLRGNCDLLLLYAESKMGVNLAIRNAKVDGVILSENSPYNIYNRSVFQHLKENHKFVFIDLKPFITHLPASKIRSLLGIIKWTSTQQVYPYQEVRDPTLARSYRNYRSLFHFLGFKSWSTDLQPLIIRVEENRKRNKGRFFADSVEIDEVM